MMQPLVGIVRTEDEMVRAVDRLRELWARSEHVAVRGHREYNPGWHTAMDLRNLLTVSEATARAALERRESPEGITITDNAIIPLKERIVDESYDPVRLLLKRIVEG